MTADPSLFAQRKTVDVEQGQVFAPKFDDNGLITVVTVDAHSGEVLMVAYMNEVALAKTIELGEAVYWSRSRKELWHKGATSGLTQKVKEILTDCDQDALVLRVESVGGACCHVGYRSCFYRALPAKDSAAAAEQRPLPLSYTQKEKSFDPEKVYSKKR